MANRRKNELRDFEAHLLQVHGLSPSTIGTYTTMVRGIINKTDLTADQIVSYAACLPANSAALTRSAWRAFCEYVKTIGYTLPNPFGVGYRTGQTQSINNVLERAGVPLGADDAQTTVMPRAGSALGTTPPGVPAQRMAQPYTPQKANMLEMPEHVDKAIRMFIHRNPGIMKVLHRLRWDWTVFNEYTQRWETAYPGEKVETWLILEPEFLDIIGPWGYGEERPKMGHFIPKAYQSIEPVPDFVLRSVFGDGK